MAFLDAKDDLFNSIRDEFYYKYKTNIEKGDYHPKDLERIKRDSNWLRAFYKHAICDDAKTVTMVHDVLTWRKQFEANDLLTPGKYPFPEEMLTKGYIFVRNEDINCQPLFHFIIKLHKKDLYSQAQLQRFIAWFFERAYKFNIDDPIVLLFDMSDAGLSNLDMKMIEFVVNCLKTYYAGLIDYMILYQMPFIFNAAWKIIKNWLPPEALKIIKFVDKKSIREFVQESQLFVHMGGTDTYKYVYNAKDYAITAPPPAVTVGENSQDDNENDHFKSIRVTDTTLASESKITKLNSLTQSDSTSPLFLNKTDSLADKDIEVETQSLLNNKNVTKVVQSGDNLVISGVTSPSKMSRSYSANKANELNTELSNEINEVQHPNSLTIEPREELKFSIEDGNKNDITQHIKLTNPTDTVLAYKIKITSPDKFRVKPGTGLIEPSGSVQITVNFLKEFHSSTANNRDKFLILWTQADEKVQASELNDFWKQCVQKKVHIKEHKIKCVIQRPNDPNKSNNQSTVNNKTLTENPVSNTTTATTTTTSSKPSSNKVITSEQAHPMKPHIPSKFEEKFQQVDDIHMINLKLNHIEITMNSIDKSQQKLSKQFSTILFLIYFLILLNLIQILFQSNLFTQVIEPYIDYFLFQKKN